MFDFAWSEIALIAVVALVLIGPKDMPVAIRAITGMLKKARRMAGEFQTHVDEMVREANLSEVRNQISEIRNFDIKGEMERAVDADGAIRGTFAGNPLDATHPTFNPAPAPGGPIHAAPAERAPAAIAHSTPPAFLPPDTAPPQIATAPLPAAEPAPAFIPPGVERADPTRG